LSINKKIQLELWMLDIIKRTSLFQQIFICA
jgi:hypothetical protein